jgi:hypothetical protein
LFALHTVKSPRDVYGYIRYALESGNTISYLTTSSREILTRDISEDWSGVSIYISSNQLSILSAYDYFPRDAGKRLVALKANTVSSKLLRSKNSIVVLCPGAISEYVELSSHESPAQSEGSSTKVDRIKQLETSVGAQFHDSIIVCCLFDKFVQCLEIVPLLHLLKHHQLAIRSRGEIIPLSEDDILGAMNRGIDAAMGDGCSTLLFKTIHHVYNIDENTLLLKPEVWHDKLKKLLGERSSALIEKAITKEIRKLITQQHQFTSGSK